MVPHAITISALKTTASALALAAFVAASPAGADPIYHLTLCGGSAPTPGSPCYVQSSTIAPTPEMTVGLTDDAIRNFLVDSGNSSFLGDVTHTIAGANSAGYVWGNFYTFSSAADLFVFNDGRVICCTADKFFSGIGINDNGLIVGNADTLPFISPVFYDSPAAEFPALDADSDALLAGLSPGFPAGFWLSATFLAVDDASLVSGIGDFGAFLLTPADLLVAAPEPGSMLLLIGALTMLTLTRARRAA